MRRRGGGGLWRCLYSIPMVRRGGGGVMEMFVYYSRGEEGEGGVGYGDVCILFPG